MRETSGNAGRREISLPHMGFDINYVETERLADKNGAGGQVFDLRTAVISL